MRGRKGARNKQHFYITVWSLKREEMERGKMEKPEGERCLLLKCLPPVGNIPKQSGTKTPRTCSLQNVPKGDFFQSILAGFKLLPQLEQHSKCPDTAWLKLAWPPTWLKSHTVYVECLNGHLHSHSYHLFLLLGKKH